MLVDDYKCFAAGTPVLGSCCKVAPAERVLVSRIYPHYGYGEYLPGLIDRSQTTYGISAFRNRYLGMSGTVTNWDAEGATRSGSVVVDAWTGAATLSGTWWRGYDPDVWYGSTHISPINETYVSSTATTASWKRTWPYYNSEITWSETLSNLWTWDDFLAAAYARYLDLPWTDGVTNALTYPLVSGISCWSRMAVGWTSLGIDVAFEYDDTVSGFSSAGQYPSYYEGQKMQLRPLDARVFSGTEYLDLVLQGCDEAICYPEPCEFTMPTPMPLSWSPSLPGQYYGYVRHVQTIQIRDQPCPP